MIIGDCVCDSDEHAHDDDKGNNVEYGYCHDIAVGRR